MMLATDDYDVEQDEMIIDEDNDDDQLVCTRLDLESGDRNGQGEDEEEEEEEEAVVIISTSPFAVISSNFPTGERVRRVLRRVSYLGLNQNEHEYGSSADDDGDSSSEFGALESFDDEISLSNDDDDDNVVETIEFGGRGTCSRSSSNVSSETTTTQATDENTALSLATTIRSSSSTDDDNDQERVLSPARATMNHRRRLMNQIKDAGIAGVISYMLWGIVVWILAVPIYLISYKILDGNWPTASNRHEWEKLGGEIIAFVTAARPFLFPFRVGLALATTPWIQTNVVDTYLSKCGISSSRQSSSPVPQEEEEDEDQDQENENPNHHSHDT